jgi:hypothetical protein
VLSIATRTDLFTLRFIVTMLSQPVAVTPLNV